MGSSGLKIRTMQRDQAAGLAVLLDTPAVALQEPHEVRHGMQAA
jgi:hypothetical protein